MGFNSGFKELNNQHWYGHLPKSVATSHEGKVTILWNQQVRTDRTIPNNKSNIIIVITKKGACTLKDVAIPGDKNLTNKEA